MATAQKALCTRLRDLRTSFFQRAGENFQPYREGNHVPVLGGLIPRAAVKSGVRVQTDGKLEGWGA